MTNYKTWMADCTEIHYKTLGQLCLPATHASGTYDLSDTITPCESEDLADYLDELKYIARQIDSIPGIGEFIPDPFAWLLNSSISTIRGLAKATSRRVLDQLNDGIRCLDLRIYCDSSDPFNPQFYTHHNLRGSSITDILSDIQTFLTETSGEIVYVTMGHWCGFMDNYQYYDAFNQLVKNTLKSYAYVQQQDSNKNFTNNPFNQTYNAIVSATGQTQSTVILVLDNDASGKDPVFWPWEFSPPDNDKNSSSVLAGYYTETSDVNSMVSTQSEQFQSNKGQLPFALYMTLTPRKDECIKIYVAQLASVVAEFGALLLAFAWYPPTWVMIPAFEVLAAYLALYGTSLFWTTLRELSLLINDQLQSELVSEFQSLPEIPFNPQNNQITFIYVDTYEDTNVVDLAIQYSGGILANAPRMTQVYGVMNPCPSYDGYNNLEIFGIGTDNCLYHAYYDSNGWNNWVQEFEDANFEAISVFGSPNFLEDNLEIFAIDESSTLWHNWYTCQSAGWQTSWYNTLDGMLSPSLFVSLFLSPNFQNDAVELFAIDAKGVLWYTCYYLTEQGNSTWNNWTSDFCQAPPDIASVFGITNDITGNFELFAIDEEGTLWHTQWTSSSGWQSSWTNLIYPSNNPGLLNAPSDLSSVFAIMNAVSGSLELFAVNTSGNLWHNYQTDTNNNWSGWDSGFHGAPPNVAAFHAVTNSNQNLEIFVIDDSGVLWHNWYDGKWQTSWQENFNGAPLMNSVFGVINTRSGSLELYGLGDNDILWHCWCGPDSLWQPWDIFLSWD
jgi:phosphatidylinositol-specific phospholipase C-like protein